MAKISEIITKYVNSSVSDIHFHVGEAPHIRVQGDLNIVEEDITTEADIKEFMEFIELPNEKIQELERLGACDCGYDLSNVCSLRLNFYKHKGDLGVAVRVLNGIIPDFDTLNLPEYLKKVLNNKSGLVLVTGLTGNGKSTTIASLVNIINKTCKKHIVTIEDPIEYKYPQEQCFVTQKEVPGDCCSFEEGLRAAMRQDPDIIVIGEMRDRETINVTIEAAESGHLVFSTLHTSSAAASVDRLISYFPEEDQSAIRSKLANALTAVFTQKLIPTADGEGMVPAIESLFATIPIKSLIREGKIFQITNYLKINREQDMYTMEDYLAELVNNGIITEEAALPNANDPLAFASAVRDTKVRKTVYKR